MESATRQELEELRVRAYGPAADIHTDPDALARLHELEQRGAPIIETPVVEDPPPIDDTDTAPAEVDEAVSAPETEPANAPSPWRVSRRIGVIWVASIVAVAGVTYAFASISPVSPATGARQVATLEPDPAFEMPAYFGGSQEATGFDDFYGLTAFDGGEGFFGYGPHQRCFAVAMTSDLDPESDGINGPIFSGCSAGAFPATIQLAVDGSMPEALREQFPEGSAIQFVLDGDRVGVFSDANLP